MRPGNRNNDEMRKIKITKDFMGNAHGSVLIECGDTQVLCTAMFESRVPSFKVGSGEGWLTAEYAMLPASTLTRKSRETLRPDGRSVEISRLIGRSLRSCVDLRLLGEKTFMLDCDVIRADGGTRTASITGAFIALCLAVDKQIKLGNLERSPILNYTAAISMGITQEGPVLDLCYEEDSTAIADMNLVMTGEDIVEVQGTGEGGVFSRAELNQLLDLGSAGIAQLMQIQKETLGEAAYVVGQQ